MRNMMTTTKKSTSNDSFISFHFQMVEWIKRKNKIIFFDYLALSMKRFRNKVVSQTSAQ